jgi:tight adherence protein B
MVEFSVIVGVALASGLLAWLAMNGGGQWLHRYRTHFNHNARLRLQEFFLFLDPTQLWVLNLVLAVALSLVLLLLTGAWWLAALCFVPAFLAPYVLVRHMQQRRIRALDRQLPEFLLALAGAIQSGSGLQQAFRHIGAQCPAPLGQELGLLLRESRMGIPFEQALANLALRLPVESIHLCVSSLRIASQTGGSLGPLLEELAATLRARHVLDGKVRALTSQGRLQAWIMAALPLVLAGALAVIDPQAMAMFHDSAIGWAVIGLVVALDVLGLWMIRRIVDIRV